MNALIHVLLLSISLTGVAGAESPNLVTNPGFEIDEDRDGVPDDWTAVSPSDVLRPAFTHVKGPVRTGGFAACLRSEGGYRFGYFCQDVPVAAGKTYEVVVRYRCRDIDNPNRCVLVHLVWGGTGWNDGFIAHWKKAGEWFEGRQKFAHRAGNIVRVMLMLRIDGPGSVYFEDVEIRETTPNPRRVAKVASYSVLHKEIADRVARAKAYVPHIEKAAQAGCDIICLTEALNAGGDILKIAEPIPGPIYSVLAEAAAKNKIYLIGCIWEQDGEYVYNTAFLLDRQGKLVGKYRKTHLHFPETFAGVRPGTDYPVFDCDFGRIGIMICYDNWFPEVSRVLALKGAEIIFCPNAGYGPTCMLADCCTNGTYFVSASSGSTAAENIIAGPDFRTLANGGPDLLTAELELSEPKPWAYRQWQTCGMPQAFRQMPHTTNDRCLEEILELYRSVPTPESLVK